MPSLARSTSCAGGIVGLRLRVSVSFDCSNSDQGVALKGGWSHFVGSSNFSSIGDHIEG